MIIPDRDPDEQPVEISTVITVPDDLSIADLNVRLDITHTWVGDLRVSLEHVQTGTAVTVLDRPGVPALPNGCSGNDISATLDDQSSRGAQDECERAVPTMLGRFRPDHSLSAFSGESSAGIWRLTISDNAPDDTGSLRDWCLEINVPPSPPPLATDFTCTGAASCTIAFNQPFMLGFNFTDADGNASQWRIVGQRNSDGMRFGLAQNLIQPPAANGSVPLSFAGFACPQGNCVTTEYDLFLVVYDSTLAASEPVSVHVAVLGSP